MEIHKFALDPSYLSYRPIFIVTIKICIEIRIISNLYLLYLYKKPIRKVLIYGIIVEVYSRYQKNNTEKVVYRIDDGTGIINCWKYYDPEISSTRLLLGDFALVKGQLNVYQGELILLTSSIQQSKDINMESLHIATVLKREQEESKLPLITNSHVIENFSDGQMSQRLNGFEIAELCLLFNFESSLTWRRKLLSLCSCQYLRRQVCTPEPYIRSLLYCSCLSKYTHLDPDGIIRLNMLHYLHRIEVVLKSQGNLMLLEDLMNDPSLQDMVMRFRNVNDDVFHSTTVSPKPRLFSLLNLLREEGMLFFPSQETVQLIFLHEQILPFFSLHLPAMINMNELDRNIGQRTDEILKLLLKIVETDRKLCHIPSWKWKIYLTCILDNLRPIWRMVTLNEVELAIDKILYLQYKGILLEAYQEYQQLLEMIKESEDREIHEFMAIEKHQQLFHDLTIRYHEIHQTITDCTSSHDQWTLGSDRFGVPTYYRLDDDGLLCLRLEGTQETPIFEQMAVLYEVALHSEWVPFCDQSNILKKMSHSEFIWYSHISTPIAVRDLIVHLYAADCTKENGCIAFVGKSINEYPDIEMPPEPNPFFGYRMDLKFVRGIIHIESPTMAKTVILAKVNVKVALPQTLINFILKQIAGIFLYQLQQQALKVIQQPDSPHARAIHENIKFYTEFLLPIIRSYCQMKGWEQVPILVLGDAGLPDSEDYSNYPNYEPFAYRDRVLHHTDEDKKKAKSKRKSSPMKLSVV